MGQRERTAVWIALCLAAAAVLGLVIGRTAHGEVNSEVDGVSYTGNGSTVTFSFPFGILATTDLRVVARTLATGAEQVLVLNSAYTMTDDDGDGDYTDGPGGSITTANAWSSAYELHLTRRPPLTQTTNLDGTPYLRLAALEDAVDKLVYQTQYLRRLVTRALLIPETEGGVADMNLPPALDRAGAMVGFDAAGDPYLVAGLLGPNDVNVSDWWRTGLALTTQGAVGHYLGVPAGWLDVTAEPFNAAGDGVTDDTNAVQAAYDAAQAANGGTVYFPPGVYLVDDVNVPYVQAYTGGGIVTVGASPFGSRLIAPADGSYCLVVAGWNRGPTVFRNLGFGEFDGPQTYSGVKIQPDLDYPSLAGVSECTFENCSFQGLDIGVYSVGNLMTKFAFCFFRGGNYGLYWGATDSSHGGCLTVRNCSLDDFDTAALALIGLPAVRMEQVEISHCVMQGSAGFAIFAKHCQYSYPLVIEAVYEEVNGSGTNVTIDGVTYGTVPENRLDNCGKVLWSQGAFPPDTDVNATDLVVTDCLVSGDPNVTGDSHVRFLRPSIYTETAAVVQTFTEDATFTSPLYGMRYQGPLTNNPTSADDCRNLIANGTCATGFTPVDVNGLTIGLVDGGPVFKRCLRISDIPLFHDADDYLQVWPGPTLTEGKTYAWSLDVRGADGTDGALSLWAGGGLQAQGMIVENARWRRYWGAFTAEATGPVSIYLWNPQEAFQSVDLADFQLVEFAAVQDAYDYIRSGRLAVDATVPRPSHDDTSKLDSYHLDMVDDNGKWFSSQAAVTFTLAPAVPGQELGFLARDGNDVQIDPNASEIFRGHGAGKYLRLDDAGGTVRIKCFTAGIWDIIAAYDPNVSDAATFKWEP